MSEQIDTGDEVLHKPTGEHWVVAYVQGDRIAWCGWPEGEARLGDCMLWKKATPDERDTLLRQLSEMSTPDSRQRYAAHRLVTR